MHDAKHPRRPVGGGYARGEETRLRIIAAAIELFGEHGFDGASTRDIAARAEVNAPALQYYFDSKEGLYRACAEHIADTARASFEPAIQRAWEILRSGSSVAVLIDAFLALQDAIADKLFDDSRAKPDNFRLFFAREQAGSKPDIASKILNKRLRAPLHEVGAELVARIGGTAPADPITRIRVLSLHGQLTVFHTARRSALTLLGWPDLRGRRGEAIRATVRAQTMALLKTWNREAKKTPLRSEARPHIDRI